MQAADPLGYVLKPFDPKQLQLTINACLATRRRLAKPQSFTEFPRTHLLETIFQSVNECVSVADTRGIVRYANPAAARLVGMENPDTAEARLAKYRFYRLDKKTPIPWEDTPAARALQLGEASESIELYLLPPNGSDGILINMDTKPLYDEGHRTGCLMVYRDIGEQKRIESELRGAAANLRFERDRTNLILDHVADGVIVTDGAGRVVLFNSACQDMFGWPDSDNPEITPESTFDGLMLPNGSTPFPTEQLPILKALRGIPVDHVEMYTRNPKGKDVHMNVSARPILDEAGQVFATVAVVRDLTTLKVHEAELEATADQLAGQTQLLNAMLDGIPDGAILLDSAGNVRRVNPAALEILSPEFIQDLPLDTSKPGVGLFYADRMTPVPRDDLPYTAALRGETRDQMRLFIVHPSIPNGVLISISTRAVRMPGDTVTGVVMLFRDVTTDHQREQTLIDAFAEGHQEATGTVLHNVGNALNNAVTGIESMREQLRSGRTLNRLSAVAEALESHSADWVGYLQNDPQGQQAIPLLLALQKDWKDEHGRLGLMLERTAERVQHIAEILRAQRSSGFRSTDRKIVPLKKAVWDGVRILEASLQRHGITITVDCARAPREVDIQESRFHQMLVNLVRNCIEALKDLPHSDPGHRPAVSIIGYVEGDRLFLDVTDNGAGIEPKHLGDVFAPGFTTKKAGSGLGLHSAANYVIDSGGRITALSEGRGQGATIRIQWPLELRVPPVRGGGGGGG